MKVSKHVTAYEIIRICKIYASIILISLIQRAFETVMDRVKIQT